MPLNCSSSIALDLLAADRLLEAVEASKLLPADDPARRIIEQHAAHITSPEAYREYYRSVMRGVPCPEEHIFRRHEQITRFGAIRRLILERGHKTVLDLGCLDGWQLLNLAASGVTGVGVDLNREALEVARARAAKWGFPLMFVESAIEDFDIDPYEPLITRFDAVILSEVLEHVLDPVACLKTAARHLAPGGIVYVSVPATPIPHHGKAEDAREHLRVYGEDNLVAAATAAGLAVTVDREVLPGRDQETGEAFANRTISFRRATITVYCNHVTNGWDPRRAEDLGGSEEMVVRTAEAWARAGHDVTVHQNGMREVPPTTTLSETVDGGTHRGVRYVSRSVPPSSGRDLLVLFKTTDYADVAAGTKVFWTTDLPQPGGAALFLPPRVADQLDAVACISEFQRRTLLTACPWLDPTRVKVHWLGIDADEMADAMAVKKMPGRVLYASSYDRGLGTLLELWPRVRERVPDAELHVTYGWDFWKRSEAVVPADVAESMRAERARLERLLMQPGVVHLGRLPRADFLRELGEASVWAYPCTGGELCCKTALEAQAARCFPVVVSTMALEETVQYGSRVQPGLFLNALVLALTDPPKHWPDALTILTWDDLASWLWGQAADRAAGVPLALTAECAVPTMPEPTAAPPERFAIPACTGPAPKIDGLNILMAVRGMPFDGNTDRERSLGGSETVAIQFAREMTKRGHAVTVFSNFPEKSQPGKFDGVSYLPVQEFVRYAASTPHDVSIVQREPMGFNQPLQSKLNVLWCHDLGLRRYHAMFRSSLWNVDYVVPVSHWHGRQLAEVYDLPPESIVPMRNGIDLEAIQRHTDRRGARDPNAVVFASRPERGLDLLLSGVFPRLLERNPKLVLYVAGYDNTVQEMQAFYDHCQRLMANLGPRAKWMGHLKKAELYGLYSRARAMLYPTRNFKEVSCLTAMETAACGLPFVATTLGALPETAAWASGASCLVEHPGREATEDFVARYVDAAWEVLHDDLRNKRMSEAGRAGASAYSWVDVAREWEDFLLGAIEQRSRDKLRLARHWWRLGDLYAAERLLPELAPDQSVAFRHGRELKDLQDDLPTAPAEHIIRAIGQTALDAKAKTILGLGPHGPGVAEAIAKGIGAAAVEQGPADFVFGFETLDCAADPAAHVREAEALARSDGHICLVVASPGVQQGRLHQGAQRRKRWVFDSHDVKELLGQKQEFLAVVIGGGGASAYDGIPLAWSLYAYRKGAPTGAISWERRTWLQAPRPSLSGCLIVKNGEGLLSRCLRSIVPYCDEVLVDDNGSTDTTPDILRRYGIIPAVGPSPIEVGFDEARNTGLARATGDFVLWIDADEELLDPFQLPKYLRWSMYDGFSISQHHFSAVPPNAFKPDLPVRVFRRTRLDGKPTGIRFFGVVHEHPEIEINHSVGQAIVLSDVHIAHDGYLTETGRRRRFERNIALMFRDRAKYPDRMLGKFLMIRDWVHLARYQLEQNGRQLSPEAAQYLESAVAAYQKDFLGASHMMAMDGLAYYNEALQHLGRGFEVQVVLKVGGLDGQPHELTYAGRVASPDDLARMVTGGARDLTAIWDGEYV